MHSSQTTTDRGPGHASSTRRAWLCLLATLAIACQGDIVGPNQDDRFGTPGRPDNGPTPPGGGAGGENDIPLGGCQGDACETLVESPTPRTRFARLSHAQWENTVQDLFELTEPLGLSANFNPDPPLGRYDTNLARLGVSPGHWQDYQRAAEDVAELVTGDAAVMSTLLPTEPDEQARAFVEQFGQRVYRRPLTAAEVDRYLALFDEAPTHYASGDDFADGVRLTIEALLQSPHFLYRVELSADEVDGAFELSDWEMASRLSYLFWNTMPDGELLAAAAAGELSSEAQIRTQAERLFDNPRTEAALDHFHFQTLEMRAYEDLDKDTNLFPQWRRELGAMMQTETQLFIRSVIFDRLGDVGDLFTSSHTFVNRDLAPLYGLNPDDFDDSFQEVELDPDERAGLLTQLGFLTENATLREPDPIHRGVFVNSGIICIPLQALPSLPDDLNPVGNTNRERVDSITGEGTCGESCHGRFINPIGFAFENYDAVGQYRTTDNGYPVNASASYRFADRAIEYENAIELSNLLAEAPELHDCYVSQLVEYAYGRAPTDNDSPLVYRLAEASVAGDASIREIFISLVTSPAFRTRSLEEAEIEEEL